MSAATVLVLALTVILDVAGQISFKLGLGAEGSAATLSLVRRVLGSRAILAGVLAYAAEFVGWLYVLSRIDLSVAFPIATLSYPGVILASRLFLGEAVPPRRWIATLFIAAGAALVGASA